MFKIQAYAKLQKMYREKRMSHRQVYKCFRHFKAAPLDNMLSWWGYAKAMGSKPDVIK